MILGIFGASSAPLGPPRGPKRGPRHEKRGTLQSTIVTKATETIRNVWLMKIKNCLITTTLPWISTLCQASSATNPPAWTHLVLLKATHTKGSIGLEIHYMVMNSMLITSGGDRVQSKVDDDTDDGGQDWVSS